MQKTEERTSNIEDTVEEMIILVKENVKSTRIPNTKHPGNQGYYKEIKTKNDRNMGKRRIKA